MSQEITVDFSEQIAKVQTKIERLERLKSIMLKIRKNALEHYKNNDVLLTDKVGLNLSGVAQCSFNASVATLIPLLEQNIEYNTALINELAKELGIEVE
ncbi:Hypothetical protein NCDO2118_1667 [Lactococcus lactis subsp. lactis NCDO 2118]|uniref:DUF1359 domain-containing protein n=1 Tax=Lactococcus lactis subsp. lactis NCDO 2118 TaxID=1117941 RepID=A0ABC8A7E8_LACLL|nr:DUF1359 domain-containing protein [Lactococcus lactis]AII13131.1 Hypothetical protein NCDO2118_1667 [Lactococcus lactis subsp. lactis NCDO 2118]